MTARLRAAFLVQAFVVVSMAVGACVPNQDEVFRAPAGRAIGAVSAFVTAPYDSALLSQCLRVIAEVPPSTDADARVLRGALISLGINASAEQKEMRYLFQYIESYDKGLDEIAEKGHTWRDMDLIDQYRRKKNDAMLAARARMHDAFLLAMGAEMNALGTAGLWDRAFNAGDTSWVDFLDLEGVRLDSLKSSVRERARKEAQRLR